MVTSSKDFETYNCSLVKVSFLVQISLLSTVGISFPDMSML